MNRMAGYAKPILLVFPFGYLAHYLRCIVLCRQLKDRYQILFAFHPAYIQYVSSEGFECFEYDALDENKVLDQVKHFGFNWLNDAGIERTFLSQVGIIEKYKPAAVLGDAVPTLKMAAEMTGVRYISLLNGYMTKYYCHSRQLPSGHRAARLLQQLPAYMVPYFTSIGEAVVFKNIHRHFKRLRQKYKLCNQHDYLDELEGDLTLICDLPYFFPQKDLPANYRIIGPLIYDGSGVTNYSPAAGKQTIYASMGSTGNWQGVAFLNDPFFKKYNIVTTGDANKVLNAPHITTLHFAEVKDIFLSADLVICHGGNGTIYQALYYGIPLLFKPAYFEQEWNVCAFERKGVGRSLQNVKTITELKTVVDDWIQRKGQPLYQQVKALIGESMEALKGVLVEAVC